MIFGGHRRIGKAVSTLLGVIATIQIVSSNSSSDNPTSASTHIAGLIFSPAHAAESLQSGQRPTKAQLSIYRGISLIQAGLLIADDLVKEHQWSDALAHLNLITAELNRLSEKHPDALDMAQFSDRLATLISAVKGQYRISYNQMVALAQEELIKAFDKYKATLPTPTTKLAISAANELLDLAATAYASSIEGGKFVDARKYQHSRGLISSAELIYVDYSVPLEKADLRSLGDIRMLINEIKGALRTTSPPDTPLLDTAKFRQNVVRIGQLSTNYQ